MSSLGRRWRAAGGFTFIELLVAMAILAIVAAAVVVRLGDGGARELAGEAERLAAILNLAAATAVLDEQPLRVELGGDGYRVMRWEHRRWTTLTAPRALAPRQLPASIALVAERGTRRTVLFAPDGDPPPAHWRLRHASGATHGVGLDEQGEYRARGPGG